MPYRRLPNTDQARLCALRTAVQKASEADFNERVLDYRTQTDAQSFLLRYENQVRQYRENFNSKVTANKEYRHIVQNARMYISHFIQVLNLAVIRGEIKKSQKELYKLDPDERLPDLSTEEDLLLWGKNIIEGEKERVRLGGFPIYNPTIGKVEVHYEIFKDYQFNQRQHIKTTSRVYDDLGEMRTQADALILSIWNQVEQYYIDSLPYTKMQQCKAYGIIYYYRTGEKKLTPETDIKIKKDNALQSKIVWSE